MVSIQFASQQVWWASAKLFERFAKALVDDTGWLPHLEHYLHMAEANGGLNLSFLDPSDAADLISAFREVAEREKQQVTEALPTTDDGSYRVTLENLLLAIQAGIKPSPLRSQH